MKYVIKILEDKKISLDHDYDQFVTNGNVSPENVHAINNKKMSFELKKAINILKASKSWTKEQLLNIVQK